MNSPMFTKKQAGRVKDTPGAFNYKVTFTAESSSGFLDSCLGGNDKS